VRKPPYSAQRKCDDVTESAAWLCLMAALDWAEGNGVARSEWSRREWERLFAVLEPREVVVVVLSDLRGMRSHDVAAWLGGITSNMVRLIHRRALDKLRGVAAALAV